MTKLILKTALLLALGFATAQAGAPAVTTDTAKGGNPVQPKEESVYDKIWNLAKIYKNDNNPVIEEFDLIGRFQFDFFNVSSDRGHTNFWEIRRFRLGEDAFFFNRHLEIKAELDTNLRSYKADEVFYNRFTNLYAKFYINDAVNLRLGKFEPHYGYDREFTDNLQKFFERGFYDDQIIGSKDYVSGAELSGKIGNWGYLAAIYSTNVDKEFGQFNGGQAYHAEINYDFSKAWGADKALWVLDYMHMDGKNKNTNVFTNAKNVAATYIDYQKGKFSFVGQLGYDNQIGGKGDIYQAMVMPGYMITDKLEVIFRYQLGLASKDNGITTLGRQQTTVGKFTGDTYNAGYIGLNYYLYGQKLKFMLGEEYANLRGGTGPVAGYSGWTTWAGFRLFF